MGRHEFQLQCSHDGAIPPWLLRHARDLDAAELRKGIAPDTVPAPATVPLSRHAKILRMATLMVERAADGACTEGDLAAAGFTRAEIEALADDARAVALATVTAREGAPHRRIAAASRRV